MILMFFYNLFNRSLRFSNNIERGGHCNSNQFVSKLNTREYSDDLNLSVIRVNKIKSSCMDLVAQLDTLRFQFCVINV